MTVDELFALGIASPDDCDVDPEEVFWQCIEELGKHRASRQIFEIAVAHTKSESATDRRFGAEVLNDFGFDQGLPYRDESVEPLADLLYDDNIEVVTAAVCSIGKIAPPHVLPRLLELSESSNEHLRWCCINHLTSFAPDRLDDQHAITKALMRLMHDPTPLVRDWATFQLGTQTTADGIAIRNAFVERMTDDDEVTQYEALRALVARHDKRATPVINQLLGANIVRADTIGLAIDSGATELVPALDALCGRADIDVDLVEEALESCRPEGRARRQHQLESFAIAAEAAGLPYRFTSDIVEHGGQPSLYIEPEADSTCWCFPALIERSNGDVRLAIDHVRADLVMRSQE